MQAAEPYLLIFLILSLRVLGFGFEILQVLCSFEPTVLNPSSGILNTNL